MNLFLSQLIYSGLTPSKPSGWLESSAIPNILQFNWDKWR